MRQGRQKKTGKPLIALSLRTEAQGFFLQLGQVPATQTRIHGPGKHDKTPCSAEKKAPGRVIPLLQGLGGYTRRMRSRAPTRTTKYKTQSRRELLSQVLSSPQESAHTPPEARGLLSDTTRRGTLSKNQIHCLSLAKIKAKKNNHEVSADSPIRPRLAPRPQTKGQSPPPRRGPLAEAPPRKASDGMPILRFTRGWARQQTSSPPPRPAPLAKRHVQINAPNYSRNVNRTLA